MGLDSVELILAVEERFGIDISDDEAGMVSTVGDLHALVVSKLTAQDSPRCLTSAAFYRTRRGMTRGLGIERNQVRPSTSLESLLPRATRRKRWRRIQAEAEVAVPDLEFSAGTQWTFLASGALVAFTSGLYGSLGVGWLVLLAFIGFAVGAWLLKILRPLATGFPNHDGTVGELARDVLAANYSKLTEQIGGWSKQDVWETLRAVIVQQNGVPRERITPDARIVADLGIE